MTDKEKDENHKAFRKEFKELLKKYNCCISCDFDNYMRVERMDTDEVLFKAYCNSIYEGDFE